ncbi:MAG: outer membrane protein assembly factor BamA [Rhizobiales bacterium]|nr:outer membrane protein assembly factor BamA [Hyphomicrobiales bacterium]
MKFVGMVRGLGLASLVLGGLASGCVVASVSTASMSYAQTSSAIVVQGNRRVEAETIRSYFRTRPGERLDAAKIDAALKALYATGLFQDVRIGQAGGRITVTVVENQVINRVAFEGNKKTKDEQLSTEVQSKPRGTFSRPMVQADVQRIVEIYRRNGRYDVRVAPKVIELPNNRVDLVFEINEGDKTGVKAINFVGNKAYSGYRLRDVIKTTESHLLSFLQTSDIYDQDRVEADRDLLRRFYLKNGYADIRILSAGAQYDPAQKGFIITFTIDEGPQYRFGTVDVQSNVRNIDPSVLRSRLRVSSGDVYNAEAVEKTIEEMTIESSKLGYAFATVRPRGERNFENRTVNLVFVVDEGPRAYIERINIRGNSRTRDYVIRREFDIAEGDAYNRALIDRAERRLKNLNFFKTVKITNEPGSAPDRVVLNVTVEEQSTGEFSVAGGYSTADGFIAEVSVAERNLLGRGLYARAAVTYGERVRGFELSFVEPYFLDYRLALGVDLFAKQTLASSYISYDTETLGGTLRFGLGLTENLSLQLRYSAYSQEITLPGQYTNCNFNPPPGNVATCYADGEASLPVKIALAEGAAFTSLVGYTLAYNTLDNNKNPSQGMLVEFRQDFAGVGGDVNFIRSTVDARYYHELFGDLIGFVRVQGGHVASWDGELRMLDHFQMGPNLVRGFAPSGFGPRDLTAGTTNDALGGTLYWGATLEVQMPLYFVPKEAGLKVAAFADAGSLWDYRGPVSRPSTGEFLSCGAAATVLCFGDANTIRSSVGLSLIWDSPFGPLRFDYAFPLSKTGYDRVQEFRFGGGTRF